MLEVPHLLHASVPPGVFQQALIAAVVAGITAWLATAFLMRYFRAHDDWALNPFAYYCLVAGLGSGRLPRVPLMPLAAWLLLLGPALLLGGAERLPVAATPISAAGHAVVAGAARGEAGRAAAAAGWT